MNIGHEHVPRVTVITPRRKPLGVWMQLKDPKLLARLMAIQGISGRQLAKLAGWESHTYLQRLLRGEVKTLKSDPALLIAKELQVPLDVLFVTQVDRKTEQSGRESRMVSA